MNPVGGEQVGHLGQLRLLARFKFGRFRNTLVKIILRKTGLSHHSPARYERGS